MLGLWEIEENRNLMSTYILRNCPNTRIHIAIELLDIDETLITQIKYLAAGILPGFRHVINT